MTFTGLEPRTFYPTAFTLPLSQLDFLFKLAYISESFYNLLPFEKKKPFLGELIPWPFNLKFSVQPNEPPRHWIIAAVILNQYIDSHITSQTFISWLPCRAAALIWILLLFSKTIIIFYHALMWLKILYFSIPSMSSLDSYNVSLLVASSLCSYSLLQWCDDGSYCKYGVMSITWSQDYSVDLLSYPYVDDQPARERKGASGRKSRHSWVVPSGKRSSVLEYLWWARLANQRTSLRSSAFRSCGEAWSSGCPWQTSPESES